MPKKSKISPAQRKDWLARHEKGERQDEIAKADKVNPRTVAEQIERARLELSFDAAQQEQLGEALRKHQEDMLGLLKRTRNAIEVPPLSISVGFDDPTASAEREVFLPFEAVDGHAIIVIIHDGHPAEIRLAEEESRLWHALKQHLGSKNPLGRGIASWERAMLKELQARAELTQVIKKMVEVQCGLPVLVKYKGQQPHLTTAIIRLTQTEVVSRSLGEPPSDFPSRLQIREGSLDDQRTATYLTQWVANPEKIKDTLAKIIGILADSSYVIKAAQAHRELKDCTRRTRDELEDYLLLHHIPGRCSLCKKLGGQ